MGRAGSIDDIIRQLVEGGGSETIIDADGRIPKDYLNWSTDEHKRRWKHEYHCLVHSFGDKWNRSPHEATI